MSGHFRKITWIVTLFLLMAMLAGCLGGGEPGETEVPPEAAPSETPAEPPGVEPTEPPDVEPTATEEDMDAAYTQAAQTIVAFPKPGTNLVCAASSSLIQLCNAQKINYK